MKSVISRIVHLVVVLFGISVLTFLLIRLLPGDPALAIAAQSGNADPQLIAEVRADLSHISAPAPTSIDPEAGDTPQEETP